MSINRYHTFLSHNSEDKSEIRDIVKNLKVAGVKTWFDEEQLTPGQIWQVELEECIEDIRAAAVFVGQSGVGPWQDFEMRAFITEFAERGCPVIPVILPGAGTIPKLPIFLKQFMWIDMRESEEKGILKILAALKT